MINDKELRPGNLYATIRNQQVIVAGIDTINKFISVAPTTNDVDIVIKKDNSIIFEDLYPIDITETKIALLGFSEDQSMSLPVVSDNTVKFIWDSKLKQVVLVDGSQGVIGQDIKFVHQLQNIYFFLTGKELPIFQ